MALLISVKEGFFCTKKQECKIISLASSLLKIWQGKVHFIKIHKKQDWLGQGFKITVEVVINCKVFNSQIDYFRYLSGTIAKRSRACVCSGFVVRVPGSNPAWERFFLNKKKSYRDRSTTTLLIYNQTKFSNSYQVQGLGCCWKSVMTTNWLIYSAGSTPHRCLVLGR